MNSRPINIKNEFDKKMTEQLQKQHEKEKAQYNFLLQSLEELGSDEESIDKSFEMLMEVPDDIFVKAYPLLLEEIEKSFTANGQLTLMLQQINMRGDKLEDVLEHLDDTANKIDEAMVGILSPVKRDFFKELIYTIKNKLSEAEGIAKRTIAVPVELCHPDAVMPDYARLGDAGMDVRAMESFDILPGETVLVPTGIKMGIPKGYAVLVQPRSGMSYKTKLRVANTPGLIDSGYRDEIKVIIENIEPAIKDITYDFDTDGRPVITSILHGAIAHIEKGERIAQIRLVEAPCMACAQVEDILVVGGNRGGGFGSTGTHEVEPRTELDDELDMAEAMATMLKLESEKENEDVQGTDN